MLSFGSSPCHPRACAPYLHRRVVVATPSSDVLPVTNHISRTMMPQMMVLIILPSVADFRCCVRPCGGRLLFMSDPTRPRVGQSHAPSAPDPPDPASARAMLRPSACRGRLLFMSDPLSRASARATPRLRRTRQTPRWSEPCLVRVGSCLTAHSHVGHRRALTHRIRPPTLSWSVHLPVPPAPRPSHAHWFCHRTTAAFVETLIRGGLK